MQLTFIVSEGGFPSATGNWVVYDVIETVYCILSKHIFREIKSGKLAAPQKPEFYDSSLASL